VEVHLTLPFCSFLKVAVVLITEIRILELLKAAVELLVQVHHVDGFFGFLLPGEFFVLSSGPFCLLDKVVIEVELPDLAPILFCLASEES
jgi:hypothetical protein